MRVVTGTTVFRHRRMGIDPRAHVFLMTGSTDLVRSTPGDAHVFVGVVAVHARHTALTHRMVGRVGELRFNDPVALYADPRSQVHVSRTRMFVISQMMTLCAVRIVAVGTVEARARVLAGPPLEMCIASNHVTLQAIRIRWITNLHLSFGFFVKAPIAVTALTVRVVGGNFLVTLYVGVTNETLCGPDPFGAGNLC